MFKTKKSRPDVNLGTRSYTSSDVSNIAAVSLRQLQWWDERKVVSPRHEGHKRVYSPEEVVEITVIAELRRKGFFVAENPPGAAVPAARDGKTVVGGDAVRIGSAPVTDGKSIYLEEQNDKIIDLLKNAKQPMFLVCVTDQVRRLNEPARKPARAAEAAACPAVVPE